MGTLRHTLLSFTSTSSNSSGPSNPFGYRLYRETVVHENHSVPTSPTEAAPARAGAFSHRSLLPAGAAAFFHSNFVRRTRGRFRRDKDCARKRSRSHSQGNARRAHSRQQLSLEDGSGSLFSELHRQ